MLSQATVVLTIEHEEGHQPTTEKVTGLLDAIVKNGPSEVIEAFLPAPAEVITSAS